MFGSNLNRTRKQKGVTAQQMADALNINIRSYRAYESNNRQPSLDALVKIADKLEVSIDYLLDRHPKYCEAAADEPQANLPSSPIS